MYKTTKNLQYIIKFIIRSRILFAKLNDDRDRALFEASLEGKHEVFERTEWNPKNWPYFDSIFFLYYFDERANSLIIIQIRFVIFIHQTDCLSQRPAAISGGHVEISAYYIIRSNAGL